MVIKKIKNPKKSSPKAARIGNLFDYILNPEATNANEKCVYSGARGFITEKKQSQKAEMLALSQEAVKSQDTINHYVMSWREGEQPSPSQIEEAISIFLQELGLEGHQVIYGLHADTDNLHLHIVVNRVHPETLKVIKPNKGFDIKAAHKAIALIEHKQGWQRERNGLYYVLENGELGREHENHDQPRKPDQIKQDMEQRTGEKSAERIAIEVGAPIIRQAKSWQALHQALAAEGLRYEKKGSGGMIFVSDVSIKPSQVDRAASLPNLQKRLGPYESPSNPLSVATRAPEPIQDVPGWATYIAGRKKHYTDKAMAINEQRTRHEAERHSLLVQQKTQREAILKGDWKGRGDLLNAMRSVLAAEQAAEKAALKERHKYEREQLRQMYSAYPDLEQWLLIQQSPEAANAWRYRVSEPQRTCGDKDEPAMPRDIRAYQSAIHGQQVHYTRKEAVGHLSHPSFVDKGREIDIHDWRSPDTVLAALQLSAQKWGSFTVTGNDEYKALCVKLAAEHGFKINNPEFQESIQAERQRLQHLSSQTDSEYQLQAGQKPQRPERKPHSAADMPTASGNAVTAYQRHRNDILKRQAGGAIDLSRVDSMIAVRMRVTGHSQAEIEGAIRQCAPAGREDDGRNWSAYAQRTARYAFGAAGDRQADSLSKYRAQWEKLEGRVATVKEQARVNVDNDFELDR